MKDLSVASLAARLEAMIDMAEEERDARRKEMGWEAAGSEAYEEALGRYKYLTGRVEALYDVLGDIKEMARG